MVDALINVGVMVDGEVRCYNKDYHPLNLGSYKSACGFVSVIDSEVGCTLYNKNFNIVFESGDLPTTCTQCVEARARARKLSGNIDEAE